MSGKRVLVCGGRDYADQSRVDSVLDSLAPISTIIEGGAPGADRCARLWAQDRNALLETYVADWITHGRAAGPIRNAKMLTFGRPDLVVAFPGGRGTANMVTQARKAGVEVMEIDW